MQITTYEVEIELLTAMLGTVPKDPEIYASYIASKGEDNADELETVPVDLEAKGWTGFHELDGQPIIYDYVIKGFFKDACSMLRRGASLSKKLTAFKKVIDGLVFIEPRQISIQLSGPMELIERPLRAQTAQGERVALARSDAVPAGSRLAFEITVFDGGPSEALIAEWLEYGQYRGLGQWRNSGAGKFALVRFEAVA
jgi:hypothetical protein